jgi:hypothetical protein
LDFVHQLRQSRITDYLKTSPSDDASYWLERNRELPRERLTFEIDLFAWKEGHWGALSIEDKSQTTHKTLEFAGGEMTMHNDAIELKRNADNLHLQCTGAGMLGRAFAAATGMNRTVIPVAVVDYDLRVNGTQARFAVHDGVVFVKREHFDWFVQEFLTAGWVQKLSQHVQAA